MEERTDRISEKTLTQSAQKFYNRQKDLNVIKLEEMMKMDREKLKEIADNAIEDYFEGIDSVIDSIVDKIVGEHKIEDEDDIDYLKAKVRLGILKWE